MRAAACLAALVGALALAAPAAADRNHYVVPAGHLTRFELQGSNGYQIVVSANDRDFVTVKAIKDTTRVEYMTEGEPTDGLGGAARFRGYGSVAFGFRPKGQARRLPRYTNCDGGPSVRRGVARGRIEFAAERDFTEFRTRRVRAEVLSWPRLVCRYLAPGRGPGAGRVKARFAAFALARPLVEFNATRYTASAAPRSRRVEFTAGTGDFKRNVTIFHSVSAAADPSSFRQPEPETTPENLVLTPPRPFRGSATLERTPESTFAWSGSLRVELPGRGWVDLAGPDFATLFCALRGCLQQIPEDFFGSLSRPAPPPTARRAPAPVPAG